MNDSHDFPAVALVVFLARYFSPVAGANYNGSVRDVLRNSASFTEFSSWFAFLMKYNKGAGFSLGTSLTAAD
ncbi:hypothetical protein [Xenorhabdus taiwanensis]|uniref:hypothetical protein n=1 Tax=Xenorhabdus taiwanensis TaxID=3085177 RepID=UPI0035A6850C